MIFRLSLAVSVLALLGNVVASPTHHDAIELQELQARPLSPIPPIPPTPRLKPISFPSDHGHDTLRQTANALEHAAKKNFETAETLRRGQNKFNKHHNHAPGYDLKHTAAKYRIAAKEHDDAGRYSSSKAQSLKSGREVPEREAQALYHYAMASIAKAKSNNNIAKNGISYLENTERPHSLHRYEKNRGRHVKAEKHKKEVESLYNAAVHSFPELDATQSIRRP